MIAKPLDQSKGEKSFYELLLSSDLERFVPQFYGVGLVEFDGLNDLTSAMSSMAVHDYKFISCSESGDDKESKLVNPWNLACLDRFVRKNSMEVKTETNCLLLEDLTHAFRHPCILDMKMGRRMYTDDASDKKKQRAIAKARATTSEALGLRLCGMQVFNPADSSTQCHDKYSGRKVTCETFNDAISKLFTFCDAARASVIIDTLLEKLHSLYKVISSLSGYRFYSSSLLVVFEGSPDLAPEADLRMIDFANSSRLTEGEEASLPDAGYLFGLNNLIATFEVLRAGMQVDAPATPCTATL